MEEKISEKNSEKKFDKRWLNLKPPYKKGQSGNPLGKPRGQRDYATLYREALIKFAEKNSENPLDIENDILIKGLSSARKGDYRFYKDVLDRLYGQPKQPQEHSGSVNHTLSPQELETINKAFDDL